jgi:hypothetical protein
MMAHEHGEKRGLREALTSAFIREKSTGPA